MILQVERKSREKTPVAERRLRQNGISYFYKLFKDKEGYSMQVIDLAGGRYEKCVLVHFTDDSARAEDFFKLLVANAVSAVHLFDIYEDEF